MFVFMTSPVRTAAGNNGIMPAIFPITAYISLTAAFFWRMKPGHSGMPSDISGTLFDANGISSCGNKTHTNTNETVSNYSGMVNYSAGTHTYSTGIRSCADEIMFYNDGIAAYRDGMADGSIFIAKIDYLKSFLELALIIIHIII